MVKTVVWYAVAALCCAALGYSIANWRWEIKSLERDKQDQAAAALRTQANQLQQDAWQAKISASHDQYEKDLKRQKDDADSAIAGWRAGEYKLREKFQCLSRGVSEAASSSGVTARTRECGLSERDVENLIRIAQRANEVKAKLENAQRILKAIYGIDNHSASTAN